MTNRPKPDHLREALILVFLAVLIAAAKVTLKLPLKLPGHTMLVVMFLMCLGRALTGLKWAGLFMGCAAGAISLALGGGFKSINVFANHALVGLALDLLFLISDPIRHGRWWLLPLWGGLAAISRSALGWLRDLLAGTDLAVIVAINGYKVLTGMTFAAVGAVLAGQLIKVLGRHGYVAYDRNWAPDKTCDQRSKTL